MKHATTKSMPHGKFNRGVTLLEFALVIPVFLATVLGLLYIGLSLSIQGVLDHAASRALATAVTLPELSEERVACVANSTAPYCQGLDAIRTSANNIIHSSLMIRSDGTSTGIASISLSNSNPHIIVPEPNSGESYQQAFERTPIVIEITAQVNSFLPGLPAIIFKSTAAGFYEVRSALSYPVPVDCNGNPKNSPLYGTQACDCSSLPNAIWNPETRDCELCSNDRLNHLDPDHVHYIPSFSACACPSDQYCQAKYGPGAQTWWAADPGSGNACICGCDHSLGGWEWNNLSNSSVTSCSCNTSFTGDFPYTGYPGAHHFTGKQVNGQTCECVPPLTDGICEGMFPGEDVGVLEPAHCACQCTNVCYGTLRSDDGTFSNTWPATFWRPDLGCNCLCMKSDWTADPNRSYSGNATGGSCSCTNSCPAGKQPDNSTAGCDCVCSTTENCGNDAYWDTDACACRCHHGTYPDCEGSVGGG